MSCFFFLGPTTKGNQITPARLSVRLNTAAYKSHPANCSITMTRHPQQQHHRKVWVMNVTHRVRGNRSNTENRCPHCPMDWTGLWGPMESQDQRRTFVPVTVSSVYKSPSAYSLGVNTIRGSNGRAATSGSGKYLQGQRQVPRNRLLKTRLLRWETATNNRFVNSGNVSSSSAATASSCAAASTTTMLLYCSSDGFHHGLMVMITIIVVVF